MLDKYFFDIYYKLKSKHRDNIISFVEKNGHYKCLRVESMLENCYEFLIWNRDIEIFYYYYDDTRKCSMVVRYYEVGEGFPTYECKIN